MKSYTDLEQSKKLTEILPIESADMCFNISQRSNMPPLMTPYSKFNEFFNMKTPDFLIPCWSLAALMNLLPSKFAEKGKYSETTYNIHIRKYALTEDVDLYQIAYGNYTFHEDGNSSWKDMINTGEKENLIDAVFQMIVWLKENDKL